MPNWRAFFARLERLKAFSAHELMAALASAKLGWWWLLMVPLDVDLASKMKKFGN